VEGRQVHPATEPCRGRAPVEPARDHEVEDEEELVLEPENDALSQPLQAENRLPLESADGGIDRAQEKRTRQPNATERLPDDAGSETLDVDDDVGQLGHAGPMVERPARRVISAAARSRCSVDGELDGVLERGARSGG